MKLKRGDLVLLGLVVLLALGGLFYLHRDPPEEGEIVIQVDGEEVFVFPLIEPGREQVLDIQGPIGITRLRLEEDRVRVVESDCPDKLCVHMGWIDRPGRPIACLPNRVVVKIRGANEDFDFITK